jgi:hypothetical protein
MAGEDLEWLLRQFSSGGSSLPSLKSLGPKQEASYSGTRPQGSFQRYQSIQEGIQEPFRDILSRSPYIFAANKRQEALLAEAATLEKPVIKFASSVQHVLPASISNKALPLRNDSPVKRDLNRSPTHAAAAAHPAAATVARNGRSSAPPALETGDAAESGKKGDRRGKQAVIQRLEQLRNDDDALLMLHQNVERYLQRQKEMSASRSGRLSPIYKNRKGVKMQTLENRISRLEGQKLVRSSACCARFCLNLFCDRRGSKPCSGCSSR